MESIIRFRQMMAEEKFHEVQRLIEVQLALQTDVRSELLLLYYEALTNQNKKLPLNLLLELAEQESQKQNHDYVLNLLQEIGKSEEERFYLKISKLKILAAEDQGRMDDLYLYLADCLLRQYEKQVPSLPEWVTKYIEKYFKHDYNLRLKELALTLLLGNLGDAEKLTQDLILQCFEKSSPKGTSSKLILIGEILKTGSAKNQLEIYQNFCVYHAQGVNSKADLKRIAEMVIYFDNFTFQVLVLNLLNRLSLNDIASEYASAIKTNPQYSFVYLDKYFSDLKRYFHSAPDKAKPEIIQVPRPDLKLEGKVKQHLISPVLESENVEDEKSYFNLIKYQNFSADQLCDLTVSFLQSEMPTVALYAADEALRKAQDNQAFLKSSYLKLNCLLQLKDFRAALDTCLNALSKATTETDILSFLYGQAEIHIRLNEVKQAKAILKQILRIDENYRLTKERLDKLNEI